VPTNPKALTLASISTSSLKYGLFYPIYCHIVVGLFVVIYVTKSKLIDEYLSVLS
jgi:hypothetical protein